MIRIPYAGTRNLVKVYLSNHRIHVIMSDIPYNSAKAICTATQIRNKLVSKLGKMLGGERIVGSLDRYIESAAEKGMFDDAKKKELLKISRYCDSVLFTSDYTDIPEFDVLLEWSKVVDEL